MLTENTDYTLSADKKTLTVSSLQKKLDVHVEFSNQFYTVSAQSDTHGSVTAAVGDVPVLTFSVLSGTEVTFTTKPSFAMGIAGWQYRTSENGTWINSSVTGLSYTIRNLQSNIWVRALVNDNATPTVVNCGVVDENGHTVEGGTLTAKNGSNTFDSGAKQPAGSTIVFTATPKDGYQVEGGYTAANGSTAITGTASEQNSYTLTNLTNAANVYVAFEKIPTYDITVDTTGRGRVTATVNGAKADITDGTFRPNAAVTREQAAAILYRCAQSKNIDVSVDENTNILSFADAQQASEYAIPALQWAVGAGVLNGKGGSLLAPTGTATRAEIAAIMQRWCEKIVQK